MNDKPKWWRVVIVGLAASKGNEFGARQLPSFPAREEAEERAESLRKNWDGVRLV